MPQQTEPKKTTIADYGIEPSRDFATAQQTRHPLFQGKGPAPIESISIKPTYELEMEQWLHFKSCRTTWSSIPPPSDLSDVNTVFTGPNIAPSMGSQEKRNQDLANLQALAPEKTRSALPREMELQRQDIVACFVKIDEVNNNALHAYASSNELLKP